MGTVVDFQRNTNGFETALEMLKLYAGDAIYRIALNPTDDRYVNQQLLQVFNVMLDMRRLYVSQQVKAYE
jgi:hypothetical protein